MVVCLDYKISCFDNPTEVVNRSRTAEIPQVTASPTTATTSLPSQTVLPSVLPQQCTLPDIAGSNKNYECLMVKVVNFINSEPGGTKLPWEMIYAITYNETHQRCTDSHVNWRLTSDANRIYPALDAALGIYNFKDKCSGDPNQIGLYADANEVDHAGRGVGQFMPGTFDGITSNRSYAALWNTENVMEKCQNYLGIDRSKNSERSLDPDGSESSFNHYRTADFSRSRVGDSLCAMAILLTSGAARSNGNNFVAAANWNQQTIYNATRPYSGSGACDRGYCQRTYLRYNFAKESITPTLDFSN